MPRWPALPSFPRSTFKTFRGAIGWAGSRLVATARAFLRFVRDPYSSAAGRYRLLAGLSDPPTLPESRRGLSGVIPRESHALDHPAAFVGAQAASIRSDPTARLRNEPRTPHLPTRPFSDRVSQVSESAGPPRIGAFTSMISNSRGATLMIAERAAVRLAEDKLAE